ncbi:concanavalin A-like lectin/glucanase domain-containing protein, partial [Sporodiniella umbellata]
NYTVGAKHNDSLSRVFSRDNVDTLDSAMRIAVSIDQASQRITCGGFGTKRQSFLYGSFRSYMKLTKVKGAVAGMFVYHPEGEIDIEVVSALSKPQAYFAVHPGITDHGRASSLTHGNWDYDFDPTEDYHEYRYDWFPGTVLFYIDGIERYKMTTNILNKPGRLMFNHWTDGNANFSQGPVKEDAFLHIKNMTFFFNSTETQLGCTKASQACTIQ